MLDRAAMSRSLTASLARLLAVVALLIQAVMPWAMAAAAERSPDLVAHYCSTPGETAGAVAIGAELSKLLAEKEGKKTQGDPPHDCGDCVLGQPVPVPDAVTFKAPVMQPVSADVALFEVRFVKVARGPPLGARAPPALTDTI
ncbi:hypothetical protein BBF93_03750 [Hyphomonas sp. CACIAM 19H1]|uniref:DUF2946 family protein n=1 Tax=Hyphomonas sp. CACIAM 19H1 TaxID=1873716 RepID=UPI000DEE1941|nr:DUF2946 family protein [Hyphomonas sp. CACIAM 19H1]AXE63431.1 hypothetical protein BBF93_03750 [Hyphomonas sp. CACIAM 19H1]